MGCKDKGKWTEPWMFWNHFTDAKEAEVQKDLGDPAEPQKPRRLLKVRQKEQWWRKKLS